MEKKFYYTDGKERFGPYLIEDLKLYRLTESTLVWAEGMSDWKPAGQVPELAVLFSSSAAAESPSPTDPFEYVNQGYGQGQFSKPKKPKTWLLESILVLILCCWPMAIPAIIQAVKVSARYDTGDYQGAKEASENAQKWVIGSFIAGLVLFVIGFTMALLGG